MIINNKLQKTQLAELELLKCPLCGGQISSQKYGEAMENLRTKTEQSYEQRLQDQKFQSEKILKQLTEEHEKQLIKLSEFYAHQNKVMKDEITTTNNRQIRELKQNYEEISKKQKEQLEISNKETENSLKKIIQDQRRELDQSKDLQRKSKELGLREGKIMADKDMDELKNQLIQKNIQLQRLNTDLEKLKDETNKTQPELVGEAGEVNLYSLLENEFKNDIFERPKRGSSSADIIQRIRVNAKTLEIPIVYDNKESDHITKTDIEKAKKYKFVHKTNYVMIVSKNLPKKKCDTGIIGEKEGILLVHTSIVLELTRQIRKFVIDLSREKISQQDRKNKEEQMFTFITSQEVARKLNTLYESYNRMKELQTKEQRDHQNLWKTKDIIMEHLLSTYVDITGGIDSIVEGNTKG